MQVREEREESQEENLMKIEMDQRKGGGIEKREVPENEIDQIIFCACVNIKQQIPVIFKTIMKQ